MIHTSTHSQRADRDQTLSPPAKRFFMRIPAYAYAGLALNLLAWASSWTRIGPSAFTFFPIWLGFILLLDGLVFARQGSSMVTRSWPRFILTFVLSMPVWWLFEAMNAPVQNWHYVMDQNYSPVAYNLIASLDFSIVLPGVFEIASLLTSFALLRPRLAPDEPGPRLSTPAFVGLFVLGIVCLILPIFFPRYAFGLLWLFVIFLLDPINNRLGRKSAFGHLLARDWRFIVAIPLATICCGFFWEMWNYFALPKWYYTVPFVDRLPHLFEMPLPGYLGYLPFGIELFAIYQFLLWLLGQRKDNLSF